MQYISSALGLLSRLSLFVVVTPILAVWFFVWMVIATAFAWFAWLIVIIILSDLAVGEALWHWFVFWPMTITGWIIGGQRLVKPDGHQAMGPQGGRQPRLGALCHPEGTRCVRRRRWPPDRPRPRYWQTLAL